MNTATAVTIAVLTALTPTVTCLIGIILSRQDVRDLRTEMNGLRAEMNSSNIDLRAEINNSSATLRTEMITFRNQIHAGLLLIHERVKAVETRQGN